MEWDEAPITLIERVRAAISLSESHFREFKSAFEGAPGSKEPRNPKSIRRDIGEALVAFANADGGVLLVGVEDDGRITGVPHRDQVLETLGEAWKTAVHPDTPLPPPRVGRLEIDGLVVLYFSVEKSTTAVHLTSDGRCVQRSDRETVPVASEQVRFERRERLSRDYDRSFVDGAELTDLDAEVLNHIASHVADGLSPEKVLQLLDLAEFDGIAVRLRRAALLLMAQDIRRWHPRCEVRVLRVEGTELKTGRDYNVVQDTHVAGCILDLINKSWDEIRPYLVETRLGPDGRFQEQVRYPEDACREALTNAIAHRDYSIEGRAVEVYVFDDRVEVQSPGALLSTVTVEGLRKLHGLHQSRNSTIARTLSELGYMREMGEGFRRMFQLMRAHDLVEPEIQAEDEIFVVALRHQSVFSNEDQRWIAAYENFDLERDEEKVMLLGRRGDPLSVNDIMGALDLVDTEDYRHLIERLQRKGLIRGIQKRRETGEKKRHLPRWTVIPPVDADRYLGELLTELHRHVADSRLDRLTRKDFSTISGLLSSSSPYLKGELFWSCREMNLVDPGGEPVGRFRALVDADGTGQESIARRSSSRQRPSRSDGNTSGEADESDDDPDDLGDESEELSTTSLFVDNLDFGVGESELSKFFSVTGGVVDVVVPPAFGRPGRNRGYAFVEVDSKAKAEKAIDQLNGEQLSGRPTRVTWSRRRVK